jgi:hypothetical protein
MLTDTKIQEIRSRFPVFRSQIHLCSCTKGAVCDVAEGGLQEFVRLWQENGIPWNVWGAPFTDRADPADFQAIIDLEVKYKVIDHGFEAKDFISPNAMRR